VLLFRYSALTFNGHRIHYDRRYAKETEGYPGLVVHGPLLATLLLALLTQHMPLARIAHYQFRALRPVFDTHSFMTCGAADVDGKTIHLWVRDQQGFLCMEARATIC
jgi:3-methylfumaryl-CoA hydratase